MKFFVAAAAAGLVALPAFAGTTTQTFDTPVVTGASEAPGTWYTDRRAPAQFYQNTADNTLTEMIAGADQDPVTTPGIGFNNTQGRKYDLAAGTTSLSVDLYVSGDWVSGASATQRKAGLWGTGIDDLGNITAYPIVEFANGGFEAYDSNTGLFTTLGLPSGFNYGQYYTMTIALVGDQIVYTVGDLTASYDANGTTQFANIMLQGYNYGTNYKIHWDNVATSTGAAPEPASWAMMVAGFGLLGTVLRRRRSTTVRFA